MIFDSVVVQSTCQLFPSKLVAVTIDVKYFTLSFFQVLLHPSNTARDFTLPDGNGALIIMCF